MIITDDFLDKKDLDQLDEYLMSPAFPWYLQKEQVAGSNDGSWFCHIMYDNDVPKSDLYNPPNFSSKSVKPVGIPTIP